MLKQYLLVGLVLSHLFANATALACSPAPGSMPKPIAERVDSVPLVFAGTVLAIEEDTATVLVDRYFKGDGPEQVQIHEFNTHSCSTYLQAEQQAVFFAEGDPAQVLTAIYDGAFGATQPLTDEILEAIAYNAEQNAMLDGQNCAALFDGRSLYVPCVKIADSDEVYSVEFQLVALPNSNVMRFDLSQFRKHSKQPANGAEGIAPFYAAVDTLTVNLLESMPIQANVQVEGYLRNSCEQLSPLPEAAIQPDRNGQFNITLTTNPPTDEACLQVVTPYSVNIPLDVYGLDAGVYRVNVNKTHTTRFELSQDNVLPNADEEKPIDLPPLPDIDLEVHDAALEGAEILIEAPNKVSALISGYLRDGCERLADTPNKPVQIDDNGIFNVDVQILTPNKAAAGCLAVITPFTKQVELNVKGLAAGTYTVNINDELQLPFELGTTDKPDIGNKPDVENPQPLPLPMPDFELEALDAALESADILIAESFPVQVSVMVNGYLRNGCETLSDKLKQPVALNDKGLFAVPVQVLAPADKAAIGCAAVITPFTQRITLDVAGLKAGSYQVHINDELQLSFELAVDNKI